MINIPRINIGGLEINIIQGGMGVGISGANLASAVAEEGGMGTIASVGLGLLKGHFEDGINSARKKGRFRGLSEEDRRKLRDKIYAQANSVALAEEIRAARKKTEGVLAVNILHALTDYSSLVETSVRENIDAIVVGAGLPKDLPKYLKGRKDIKLIPIISSARGVSIIIKAWERYLHPPDLIVVEGPKAGGHLGYSREQLQDTDFVKNGLERILPEIISQVGRDIPIIAAGGIYTGRDIKRIINQGASGVQMATRFVTTQECDANYRFKQTYLDSREEDITIIDSPVGMPGRVIRNDYVDRIEGKRVPFGCASHCLKSCDREVSNYCIAENLINAQRGNMEKGFAFAGTNAHLATEILSVKDVFKQIEAEYNLASSL